MGDGMFECVGTTALCQRCELGYRGETCEPVACAPLHVAHAQIDCPGAFGGLTTFGSQCHATCDAGLSRVASHGDGHYICQPDGTWSGSIFCAASAGQQCTPEQFTCADGVCIDSSKVDDGRPDCPDGSDESHGIPPPIDPNCHEAPDVNGETCQRYISNGYTCDSMQAYSYDCHCACPGPSGLPPPVPNEGRHPCDTAEISAACGGDNLADLLTGDVCGSMCTQAAIRNWDACNDEAQQATHGAIAGGQWADTESMLSTMEPVVQMCRMQGGGH